MFCRPRTLRVLLCVALVSVSGTRQARAASAQDPADAQYRVTRWTAEYGLPQNSVKSLLQTRDGYLWIGTLAGLARFDGIKFTVFDHGNTPEMVSDAINDLAEDVKDGSLWIATGNGLLRYSEHRFERFGAEHGAAVVGRVWPAREGGVWFSPRQGRVALMQAGRIQTWDLAPDVQWNDIQQVSELGPTQLLVLLRGTLSRLDLITGSTAQVQLSTDMNGVGGNSFFEEPGDVLWLCSSEGIWKRSGGQWQRVTTAVPHVLPWPERIQRGGDGQLWVIQREENRSSLQQLVKGRLESFTAAQFPRDLDVIRLLEDREGNLWVGSTSGLFQLRPRHVQVLTMGDGLASDEVHSLACGPDDTVWVGTARGFNGIRAGRAFFVPPPAEGGGFWSHVILADRTGRFWFGADHGSLAGFRDGTWTRLLAPREQSWINPSALYEDRQNRLWIGTGSGVVCKAQDQWTHYATTNDPTHASVRVIHQDRQGDMWFGVYGGGLNRLRDGQLTVYRTALGEYNNRAWWIHEDAEGVFWVASQNGLNRFVPPSVPSPDPPDTHSMNRSADLRSGANLTSGRNAPGRRPALRSGSGEQLGSLGSSWSLSPSDGERDGARGRFFTFTTVHGLHENVINNIQEDDFGYLWLSGLRGIYRVARPELNEVAAGRRQQVEVLALGEADGMLSSECNGGDFQPAGCKDRAGRIWFPTTKGVVILDPTAVRRNTVPPPVVIEQVIADERPAHRDESLVAPEVQRATTREQAVANPPARKNERLRFGPGQARVLEIHYTANSFVAPERVRFKYRLAGYDTDWHRDDVNRRVAFYTNLRPGNYTFEVAACNNHGVWSEQPAVLVFSLAPHIWQTWPFYAATGALVLLAGFALHHQRVRGLRRIQRLEQQRAVEQERTRIARDLHDDLGASLTGVALLLEAAHRQGRAEGEQLAALAGETRSLAHELRELAWTTNPRCDNAGSLVAFIGELAERFCEAAGLECRLSLPDAERSCAVPARVRHELLVVVKELLANVATHAGASRVTLDLALLDQEARLVIQDDGRGFDPTRPAGGNGLANLRERLQLLGGSFTVESEPGHGTKLTASLPLARPQDS